MMDLRNNLYLYEVKSYKLITADKKLLSIRILKDVTGRAPSKYIASPMSDVHDIAGAKQEYVGKGESEEQALQDCIDKIADIDLQAILNIAGTENP